jgi:hypothetical protein
MAAGAIISGMMLPTTHLSGLLTHRRICIGPRNGRHAEGRDPVVPAPGA